ncbi:hypothetical protein HPB50_029624 [Hyalomma asiaticum]|nr:hypothetical protein HPB50_029624 [Hyalomma asiaticum]
MEHHDAAASPTVAGLKVKLPPFSTSDPALWFVQVESQFAASRITADTTKYDHVAANIPPATASEVRGIMLAPLADDARRVLRHLFAVSHLRSRSAYSSCYARPNWVTANLTNCCAICSNYSGQHNKPRQSPGAGALPSETAATLRIRVMASGETAIFKIAELADRLMAVTTRIVATVLAEASPAPALLKVQITSPDSFRSPHRLLHRSIV